MWAVAYLGAVIFIRNTLSLATQTLSIVGKLVTPRERVGVTVVTIMVNITLGVTIVTCHTCILHDHDSPVPLQTPLHWESEEARHTAELKGWEL